MNEKKIRKPQPKPISREVVGTIPFTQFTITTGAVCRLLTTAKVAPVSLSRFERDAVADIFLRKSKTSLRGASANGRGRKTPLFN